MIKNKIFITGINGQLGSMIAEKALRQNYEIIGCGTSDNLKININNIKYIKLDITEPIKLKNYLYLEKPNIIIHCAAWTNVESAEENNNKFSVFKLNTLSTNYLAKISKEINAKLIYISTDYVFDGNNNLPYKTTDYCNPINHYGYTKYLGELTIQNNSEKYFIIRISWLFGQKGKNFVDKIINNPNKELKVINDQFGTPTYTKDLSNFILELIQTDKFGIYHFTNWENEQYISWYDFAKEINNQINLNKIIIPVSSNEFQTKAKRPKNSKLNKEKILQENFIKPQHWKNALYQYLMENYGNNL